MKVFGKSVDVISQRWPRRMGRKQASLYLIEVHGIRKSPSTLAKYAVTGGGPAYFKDGPFVVHDRVEHLDVYAAQHLGKSRTSTSDKVAGVSRRTMARHVARARTVPKVTDSGAKVDVISPPLAATLPAHNPETGEIEDAAPRTPIATETPAGTEHPLDVDHQ